LSADELVHLAGACSTFDTKGRPHFAALVRLLIFTGARLGEIQKARWDNIDFASGTLRLSDSKTGEKTILLPAPALEILSILPRVNGNPHVIPIRGKSGDFVHAAFRVKIRACSPSNRPQTPARFSAPS
jgi:integrase